MSWQSSGLTRTDASVSYALKAYEVLTFTLTIVPSKPRSPALDIEHQNMDCRENVGNDYGDTEFHANADLEPKIEGGNWAASWRLQDRPFNGQPNSFSTLLLLIRFSPRLFEPIELKDSVNLRPKSMENPSGIAFLGDNFRANGFLDWSSAVAEMTSSGALTGLARRLPRSNHPHWHVLSSGYSQETWGSKTRQVGGGEFLSIRRPETWSWLPDVLKSCCISSLSMLINAAASASYLCQI